VKFERKSFISVMKSKATLYKKVGAQKPKISKKAHNFSNSAIGTTGEFK
jgi:hypothetical protein